MAPLLTVAIPCGNEEKTFNLKEIPDKESTIAKSGLEEMRRRLKLNQLAKEFDHMSKFMHIAYYSIGDAYLHCQVRTAVREVHKLCNDTVNMLKSFQKSSKEAIKCLQAAYHYLAEKSESMAIEMLQAVHEISQQMSKEAEKIQRQCRTQSDILKMVGDEIIKSREEMKIRMILNKKEKSYTKFDNKKAKDNYNFAELKEKWNSLPRMITNKNTPKMDTKTQCIETVENGKKESDLLVDSSWSAFFLHKAVDAINHIEVKVIDAENFWNRINFCKWFTSTIMEKQIDMLKTKAPEECRKIWGNVEFKTEVLMMYTRWMALEEICADVSTNIESILPEIREELLANPTRDEAKKYIQGIIKNIPAIDCT